MDILFHRARRTRYTLGDVFFEDDDVFNSEELKSLTFDTKGKLGMKGTMVGVYGGIVVGGK